MFSSVCSVSAPAHSPRFSPAPAAAAALTTATPPERERERSESKHCWFHSLSLSLSSIVQSLDYYGQSKQQPYDSVRQSRVVLLAERVSQSVSQCLSTHSHSLPLSHSLFAFHSSFLYHGQSRTICLIVFHLQAGSTLAVH